GGVGGCPFAGDDLVGNLPTEEVLPWLAERDVRPLDVDPDRLAALAAEARALATRFGGAAGGVVGEPGPDGVGRGRARGAVGRAGRRGRRRPGRRPRDGPDGRGCGGAPRPPRRE